MLLMTKEHHYHDHGNGIDIDEPKSPGSSREWLGRQSKFLTTSRMLQLFSAGVMAPTPGMRVIYVDGAWDLFHPGHVALLKAAREVRLDHNVELDWEIV
jgi:ethanolamine-phosphate cytidylyltransferase